MITSTVNARLAFANERLDVKYYSPTGMAAHDRVALLDVAGVPTARLGDLATVSEPARFKRAWATPEEPAAPYLRPYDVFDYLPSASEHLSMARNPGIESLQVARGDILQTCSGRNLGPSAYVDAYLERFVLSHDLVRIRATDIELSYYLHAFLNTPTGQALLRRGKSGSVIDHLTARDIADLQVPLLGREQQRQITQSMAHAIELQEQARHTLAEALDGLRALFPPPIRQRQRKDGWSVDAHQADDRLDVAFHDPLVAACRNQMIDADAVRCADLARPILPVRYKRYYVEPGHGRPIVSGRQLLQMHPVNLRYVSDRSFKTPAEYEIHEGMVIFGGVGRSEKRVGHGALVTSDRDGWLASNDVMRLVPHPGADPGWLYLAVSSFQAQTQIKALTFGSVIDHMRPEDIAHVLLPPPHASLAALAYQAWTKFADAGRHHRTAIERFTSCLDEVMPTHPTNA